MKSQLDLEKKTKEHLERSLADLKATMENAGIDMSNS